MNTITRNMRKVEAHHRQAAGKSRRLNRLNGGPNRKLQKKAAPLLPLRMRRWNKDTP